MVVRIQLSMELFFGATLHRRVGWQAFLFFKHDYEEKKTALLYKRERIFKITLQVSHFGSLFSQCACDKANSVQGSITSKIYLLICLICDHVSYPFIDFNPSSSSVPTLNLYRNSVAKCDTFQPLYVFKRSLMQPSRPSNQPFIVRQIKIEVTSPVCFDCIYGLYGFIFILPISFPSQTGLELSLVQGHID